MNIRMSDFVMIILAATSVISTAIGADELGTTPPKFSTTTQEPVLLRYRFKPGDRFSGTIDLLTTTNMVMGVERISVPTRDRKFFSCIVQKLTPEGNACINLVFTRFTITVMDSTRTFHYDSDVNKNPTQPGFNFIAAMLNQNVPFMVTPQGKVSYINLQFLQEAVRRAGARTMPDSLEVTVNQGLRGAFIRLPEKPVAVGDFFDAGKTIEEEVGIGTMTSSVRYKIHSVSADKKRVLLKPVVQYSMDIPSEHTFRFKTDSISMDGWVLFDCERGNIDRSFCKRKIDVSGMMNNQKVITTRDMIMRYVTSYPQETDNPSQPNQNDKAKGNPAPAID
jgi:hypothetical protein